MLQNFITNFGYQLLYNSVIATVIGCFIWSIRNIIQSKWEPRGKYVIWIIFMIALIFPVPIPSQLSIYHWLDISFLEPESKQYTDILNLAKEANESEIYHQMKDRISENTNKNKSYLSKILFYVIFLVGLLRLSLTLLGRIILLVKIRWYKIGNERVDAIVEECKRKLKIKRNIQVIQQKSMGPSIIGIFKIRILIPKWILLLNDTQLKCIIMHELSHYKRKDMLLNLLMMMANAFYWFNPVLMVLFKYMELDLEIATDALALRKINDVNKSEYKDTLSQVYFVGKGIKSPRLRFLGVSTKLLTRMKAINEKEFFEKHPIFMFMMTLTIGIILLITLYPTSYHEVEKPQLFLELADGNKINLSENETIQTKENASFKLIAEGGNCKKMVMYEIYDLASQNRHFYGTNLEDELYIEPGECQYEFLLECSDGTVISYSVKILSGY